MPSGQKRACCGRTRGFGSTTKSEPTANRLIRITHCCAPNTSGLLAEMSEDDGESGGVTNGVGAMRAYQDLIYGTKRGDEAHREQLAIDLYRKHARI